MLYQPTFHLGENILACHLCDYRLSPPPKSCPKCHTESIKFKGAATEMVERALHAIFPEIRTLRLDADTTRHKGSHELLFKQFRAGKADVLIGTQMIAKGLHFPMVTLVGVLNADSSLQVPDFRASETVFQLLTQVAGRSGRAHSEERSSFKPTSPTIRSSRSPKNKITKRFTPKKSRRESSSTTPLLPAWLKLPSRARTLATPSRPLKP